MFCKPRNVFHSTLNYFHSSVNWSYLCTLRFKIKRSFHHFSDFSIFRLVSECLFNFRIVYFYLSHRWHKAVMSSWKANKHHFHHFNICLFIFPRLSMWTKTSGHTKNVNRTPVKKTFFPSQNREELVGNLCLSYSLTNGIIHVLILKLIRLVIKFKCLTTEISFPAASRSVS